MTHSLRGALLLLTVSIACTPKAESGDDDTGSGGIDADGGGDGGEEERDPLRDIDPSTLPAGAAPCRAPELVTIDYVIDGDTAAVTNSSGDWETVRYNGVDTPEISHDGDPADCYGDEAKAYAETVLTPDSYAWLTFDETCTGYYDRTLAYVHTGTGEQGFFQRALLQGGYAEVLTIEPSTTFAETFEEDEERARDADRGLWGACH